MKRTDTTRNMSIWQRLLPSRNYLIYFLCLIIASTALSTTAVTQAAAAQANLTWQPPVNSDGTPITAISGYKIHYGTSSGSYSETVDVANVTSYTLNNLSDGATYFFALTDYDNSGNESGYSNEASKSFPSRYSLTATAGTGGSIVPAGNVTASHATNGTYTITSLTVDQGAAQSFSIIPDAGFHIANETVDGTSVGITAVYNFSNISADHTLTANFAADTVTSYTLSATSGTGGSISPAGTSTLNSGTSQTYTFTPVTGYSIADVKVDGVSVGAVSSYTFINITANHSISASFSINSFTIAASAGTGGTITPTGTSALNSGASQTYTITPGTGYFIADVRVDGVSVGAVSSYTFNNVTANHTISASFAINSFTVAASSGTGGTITPTGTSTLNGGASQTYTITPGTGYSIADVRVDGVSVGAVGRYTFNNVTANHTISASFAINSFTVTASSGTGGAITPTGTSNLNYGGAQTYSIAPSAGYSIADVKVDGVSAGAVSSYTFNNVTANHTISASFAINSFTITASSGTGGTITPTGTSTLSGGASQTYTITPGTGYSIADVKVDGVSVGAVSSYTFNSVTANHSIQTSFTQTVTTDGNIAPTATVAASSENVSTGQLAIKAVDGVISGYPKNSAAEWATMGELAGAWIQLNWDRPYVVKQIVIYDRPNLTDQILAGTLTFSDGTSINVGQLGNYGLGKTITFTAKTVSWVKFTVTKAKGSNVGLSEIKVIGR